MLVECNHCGAPLDVSEGKNILKCRYCGRTSRLQQLRTVAAQTPRGWTPPADWRSPPHMPAAGASYRYHRSAGAALWLIAVASSLALALGGGAFALISGGKRGLSGTSRASDASGDVAAAKLAPVTLRESPEQLAALLQVSPPRDRTLRATLSGSRFDAATFEWGEGHRDHVKRIALNLSDPNPRDEEIRKRLRDLLGRRFHQGHFRWEGCSLNFPPGAVVLNLNVDLSRPISGDNPIWREQSETLWAVVKTAALGLPGPVDPQAIRDWLGGGYPLRALASLDPDTDVDRSAAAVKALFRGAVPELHIDLSYTVALDHPLFGHAELNWPNKKSSRLGAIELRPPPEQTNFADQQALVACMTAAFGKPDRESGGDHLRGGGKDYTYLQNGGEVRIYEHMVSIRARGRSAALPRDLLQKALNAFDACGRASP